MSDTKEFERRKQDHIHWSLSDHYQSLSHDLDHYQFRHEALPEHDYSEIQINRDFWGYKAQSPFFISSMTAGHFEGEALNLRLAQAASVCRWPMGVGSQRRELFDPEGAALEWKRLKKQAPETCFFGNIGLTQIITHSTDVILRLVDSLEAKALIVHLNPLQEVIQGEGTPFFKGGLKALEKLCGASPVPIIAKEVGCGIDAHTGQKLFDAGVTVVDVAGRGGTHWGLVEGLRARESGDQLRYETSLVFGSWGLTTVSALRSVMSLEEARLAPHEVWASGGVRHGLDAAKLLALGAKAIGLARPLLLAATQSLEVLVDKMRQLEAELKIATFCLGHKHSSQLSSKDFANMPALFGGKPKDHTNTAGF